MPPTNKNPSIAANFVVLHDRKKRIDGHRNRWVFATRLDAIDFWTAKTKLAIKTAEVERFEMSSRKEVAAFFNKQIEEIING